MGSCCSCCRDSNLPYGITDVDFAVCSSLNLIPVRLLGTGGSSRVLAARNAKNEMFAVKVMGKHSRTLGPMENSFKNEVRILQTLQTLPHPNVLEYVNSVRSDDYLVLMTRMYKGGDLYDAIATSKQQFTEQVAAQLIYQMCCALKHIHRLRIVPQITLIILITLQTSFLYPHTDIYIYIYIYISIAMFKTHIVTLCLSLFRSHNSPNINL